MAYIIQNAVQIFHNGNSIILNSRFENDIQKYKFDDTEIKISGGKTKFIFETTNLDNNDQITITNLNLTYDSSIEDLKTKLLWANQKYIHNKPVMCWDFAYNMSPEKIRILLEDSFHTLNPYIYKILQQISADKNNE